MKAPKRVVVSMALFLLSIGVSAAIADETLVELLKKRFPISRIDVQNAAVEGTVVRPGARLRLEVDDVQAKRLRVTQANTKSPRFHTPDYARVGVTAGQLVTLEPGELKLRKGTELVVLDIKVRADTVRLFTHTREPVSSAGGRPVYGCTEFVFRFDRALNSPADAAPVQQAIERWLSPIS